MNASEKSAIVMLTLGDGLAAEVFKHLNTHEVKLISSSMVNMGDSPMNSWPMCCGSSSKIPVNTPH